MTKIDRKTGTADGTEDMTLTLNKSDELSLIDRAIRGDEGAGRQLIDAHSQRLFAFVWRIVRDRDAAEDVCQETFLRAFKALKGFKKEFRFSTWLFTIGYRLALNHVRGRSRGQANGYDFSNAVAENDTSQIDSVIHSEQARQVRRIIWDEVDRLSPAQKASVVMFYKEGLSCRQVAEAMEVPVATVKSHMYRARQRLRGRLECHGVSERDLEHLGA